LKTVAFVSLFRSAGNISAGFPVSSVERRVNKDADKAKFDVVVAPHLNDAFAVARWLCGNRADAQDVLQEACVRAFQGINSYSGGNARSWVLAIVRNTSLTWLANRKTGSFVSLDHIAPDHLEEVELSGGLSGVQGATPESELIAQASAEQLEKAIADLSPEFREAIVLRDLQGLSYREVAEVTALPIGTVMSRLARARQKVIEAIRKDEA
jgi:RNA polymerase sigma factor (sigma-70 family)